MNHMLIKKGLFSNQYMYIDTVPKYTADDIFVHKKIKKLKFSNRRLERPDCPNFALIFVKVPKRYNRHFIEAVSQLDKLLMISKGNEYIKMKGIITYLLDTTKKNLN